MNQNYNQEVADRGNFLKVKRYWRGWLMFYIMFLMSVSSYAQVADYLFSQENGTYQSIINNGTLVTGSNATISDYNDTKGWNITLPFSFKFNNIHYTSIYVNSNGGAIFGSDTNTGSSLISSSSSYSGAIAVMNRDLRGNFVTSGTTTSGSNLITNVASFEGISQGMNIESGGGIQSNTIIQGYNTVARTITMSKNATSSFATAAVRYATGIVLYKVDGVSPNRTFTIQWEGYNDYATDIVGSNYLSFQLKLEEGTNKIKTIYGNSYTVKTSYNDYEIGLRGASNTDYNNRTLSAGTSWSNTTAGTSNSAKVSRNNVNFPTPGLTFIWTPFVASTVPNCIAVNPTTPANNSTAVSNKTFTWPSASGGVLGYKLYVGTAENTFNLIDGLDVGNVLTHTSTTLNYLPNTQYYWKVVPYNDFGDANGCAVWTFKSLNVPNCPVMSFPAPAATNVVRNVTLTWTAPTSPSATSYDVYFGTSANPSFVANVTGTSYTPSAMLSNTTYYWKIVSKNVMGSSQECSEGTFTTGIDLVYCNPSSTSFSTYINHFSTTLGNTNISNLNSGYNTGGYQNNYGQSTVVTYAGGNFNYEFSIVGGTAGAAIWIDWDSSGTFSSSERVFVTSAYGNGPFSGTITVPATTALGDYRMRVMVDYNASAPSDSCKTTSSRMEAEDYKITVGPQPSCVIPSGFSTTEITSSAVLLNWTASVSSPSNGYDIYYSTSNIAPTAGTTPLINNNAVSSANANGLTSATTYYWWVRSDCGNMTSVWAYGGSFVTLCNSVSAFSQNWDSVTSPALPTCFSKVGTLGSVNTQTSNPASGVNTLYMYASSTSNEPTLALPEINNAQAGTHWLKFKLRANSSVGGKLQVGYLTNPADANTFVMIQEFTATTLTYAEFTCITGALPSGVKHLALRAKGLPANSMLIDDLIWEAMPSCIFPTGFSSTNITSSSAILNWTASVSSPSNGYDVYYNTNNVAPTAATTPLINNHIASPLTINGLVSATTYYWWVRSDCGNESSTWAYGGSFKTALDYCAGDHFYDTGGASGSYSANENSTTVITPTAGNLVTVTFNSFSTESGWDFLKVYDGPDASSPALHTGSGFSGTTVIPGPFTSTHPSGKLTFVFTSDDSSQSSGWDATIVCTPFPTCLVPTALNNSNITTTTATLSWTASTANPTNGYDIYYSTSNTAPTAQTIPSVNNHNSTSLNITELAHSSAYYWWVRSDCGTESSIWIYGGSFITLCNVVTVLPWTENFDSVTTPALPICTSIYNAGTGNNWRTLSAPSSYAGLSGKVLNYSYNSSNAADAWFFTPGISLVANTAYLISYNYGNATGTMQYPERMKVAVGSSPTHTAMTTELVNHPNITGGTGQSSLINFTPTVSGVYYFGFNAYSMADQNQLYVDNIKIEMPPQWTGVTNADWNTASNWSNNVVPTANTNVYNSSLNPMIISSDVTIASMTLGAAANVTVNQNKTLNVGNIAIAEGGNLTIAQNADVLQPPTAVNTGKATVKVNSSNLFRQDYTLWSSPVAGQNLRNFSPQTLYNRFSSYDTALGTAGDYVQEIVTTADMNTKTFVNAKGYLIRMPNNWINYNDGLGAIPYEGQFKGTLNNGNLEIPLSLANTKLNLVGNPYPSSISINAFFAANPGIVQNTLYFWRKQASANPANASKSGYITYTSAGIVSADELLNGYTITHIHAGQGFFVQSNTATTLNFNNSMRSNLTDTFFRSSNETSTELHRFWLDLSTPNGKVGQTLVAYMTGATQGADEGIDALYFNDGAIALTTIVNNSEYIIQGRSLPFTDTDIVPLGFKTDVAGNFTISLSNFDGLFADDQAIYLRDNTAGVVHNLKSSDYSFTTPAGVFNTRFEVLYNTTLGTNNPALTHNNILVGVKDQIIQINAGNVTMEKIELIDVSGRVIYTQDGVNATTATLENVVVNNQMLIVRIHTKESGIVTQKIIF